MQFAKRLLMVFGAIALTALLLELAAPKATHALVATLVQVTNTTANPVPNKDVDSPAHATVVPLACQALANGEINDPGILQCTLAAGGLTNGGTPYTVPAGQRLVVEQVSAFCQSVTKDNLQFAQFALTEAGAFVVVPLNAVTVPGFEGITSFTQSVHYYADAGTTLSFHANGNDSGAFCNYSANGYLVSYP
jgi:hypothetical protein